MYYAFRPSKKIIQRELFLIIFFQLVDSNNVNIPNNLWRQKEIKQKKKKEKKRKRKTLSDYWIMVFI